MISYPNWLTVKTYRTHPRPLARTDDCRPSASTRWRLLTRLLSISIFSALVASVTPCYRRWTSAFSHAEYQQLHIASAANRSVRLVTSTQRPDSLPINAERALTASSPLWSELFIVCFWNWRLSFTEGCNRSAASHEAQDYLELRYRDKNGTEHCHASDTADLAWATRALVTHCSLVRS